MEWLKRNGRKKLWNKLMVMNWELMSACPTFVGVGDDDSCNQILGLITCTTACCYFHGRWGVIYTAATGLSHPYRLYTIFILCYERVSLFLRSILKLITPSPSQVTYFSVPVQWRNWSFVFFIPKKKNIYISRCTYMWVHNLISR